MTGTSMVRWSVRRDGDEVERVTYLPSFTAEDVKRSLIEHDNYEETIEVVRAQLRD